MLKVLNFQGVGPAEKFGPIEFHERLNFITGDNGLGKSFLLDIAWWVLTRTWARNVVARPLDSVKSPNISYAFSKVTSGDKEGSIKYEDGTWKLPRAKPAIPGMVIYAGVDGSFSAWDPARNYSVSSDTDIEERIPAFNFTPDEVWNGAISEKGTNICNGLIDDWVKWYRAPEEFPFEQLTNVLDALSPAGVEKLKPGKPRTIGLLNKTEYPTLQMPYGQDVLLTHASAGMRRIAALAYLLVWTWHEHKRACDELHKKPTQEIIFLIDEIECHLHPQWQRRITPALLNVMKAMTGEQVSVQLIVATHSPLVLASVEPEFDETQDAIFNIHLSAEGKAQIFSEKWAKQGDAVNWLVSDIFGLRQARSVEAERAIEAAEAWMRGDTKDLPDKLNNPDAIHQELLRVLPGGDHFWPRWIVKIEKERDKGMTA